MTGDREAIEAVAANWQDGWNRHDAAALASLLAEDVDFVTVLGPQGWLKGRKEFQPYHAEIHKVFFKESVWRVKETNVRFVRPDVAIAHVLWETKRDHLPDRPPGEPRNGLFIWVLEKREGKWLVIAAQNTESRDLSPDQLPGVPK